VGINKKAAMSLGGSAYVEVGAGTRTEILGPGVSF